ncbi:TPA: T9SS type A sorting domain-containing protein, partial [Candidatus Poribacteria bacterium]|nr:T9SS type A sorting domain-containing protein [Candidatus Poribacteria bacterium]
LLNTDSKELLEKYIESLPERTRIRRQRVQGSAIDTLDLPVYQPYINGVLNCGAKLCLTSRWLNGITIIANEKTLKSIANLPYVDSIQKVANYKIRTPKPKQKTSVIRKAPLKIEISPEKDYGLSATQITQVHIDALHNRGYHGEGITIALLDTGFDLSHISLRNVNVLAQYDFINNDNETKDQLPSDDIGQDDHGTEVLSILAGYDQGNFVGVAYGANYLLAKTEKVSEDGVMFEKQIEEDWWVAGLEWAEQNGADIVSSSLGYSDWYSYSDMNGRTAKTTIAANIAVDKGVIVVVSAGNEGKSNEHPYISAPADGFDVVAVGSVNVDGLISDFSSIGPTYDGRIKPDLVAMGEGTYVADPSNNIGYRKANGTSMATPIVAGTLALLKQAIPEISKPKMLVKLLKYTASRSLNPDNRYGWGLINAESAYKYAKFPGSIKELNDWDPMGLDSITKVFPNPIKIGQMLEMIGSKPIRNIKFYDITGNLIYQRKDLDDARYLTWDLKNDYGRKIASGIYICIIEYTNGRTESKRIAIIQ